MKQVTEFNCGRIIAYREQGMSLRKIEELTSIPKSTVDDVLKRYEERGTSGRKRGSGRPSIINKDDLREIKKIHGENPKVSAPKLNKIFEGKSLKKVSDETVRRSLNDLNLYAYSPSKKPLLSKKI